MAYTTEFDSSAAGSAFDGSKTVAQLGLVADGNEAISGGALNVTYVSGDYNGVKDGVQNLFSRITATVNNAALAAGVSTAFVFREQANGDHYLVWMNPAGACYVYTRINGVLAQTINGPTPAQNGMSGTVTTTAELLPCGMGAAKFSIRQTNGTVTIYQESPPFLPVLGAGVTGTGFRSGNGSFSALKIEANNAATSATSGASAFIAVGDSISFGLGTSHPTATSHPDLDAASLGWPFVNLSIPGKTAAQDLADNLYAPFLAQTWTRKTALIAAGTNDLGSGLTVAQTQTNLTNLVSDFRAKGATKVVLTTITPRASVQANIDAVNAWIKAGSSGADAVVDYTANPNLTNAGNATYFQGDGLHLTDAGEQQRSNSDLAVLNALYPAAPTITGVTVSPATATLTTGTQQFSATVQGTNSPSQTVIWGASLGTITSAGLYTPPAQTGSNQSATITATAADGTHTGTATVTISAAAATITGVTVSPPSPSVTGATQQFTATVQGTNGPSQAVTWSATLGTISAAGLWTAPAQTGSVQTATITATASDGTHLGTATATVPASGAGAATITGVTISPPAASLTTGTQQFTATVQGTNAPPQNVTWSTTLGAVSAAGLYTPPAQAGAIQTGTVTATASDGTHLAAATVTVAAAVAGGAVPPAPGLALGLVPLIVAWGILPAGATSFNLYRDYSQAPVYSGAATSFLDMVPGGSTHSYSVSSVGPGGESARTHLGTLTALNNDRAALSVVPVPQITRAQAVALIQSGASVELDDRIYSRVQDLPASFV